MDLPKSLLITTEAIDFPNMGSYSSYRDGKKFLFSSNNCELIPVSEKFKEFMGAKPKTAYSDLFKYLFKVKEENVFGFRYNPFELKDAPEYISAINNEIVTHFGLSPDVLCLHARTDFGKVALGPYSHKRIESSVFSNFLSNAKISLDKEVFLFTHASPSTNYFASILYDSSGLLNNKNVQNKTFFTQVMSILNNELSSEIKQYEINEFNEAYKRLQSASDSSALNALIDKRTLKVNELLSKYGVVPDKK